MILAPLRGVTIRCFRDTFATVIREVGFTEAITPFIPAMAGINPLKDRELKGGRSEIRITPQFIGKDPQALGSCLQVIKDAGYDTADLNCGCPFPMIRNKGRGSGILKTPAVLEAMLAVGCEVMGNGKFSIKARLGVDSKDELLKLMPIINQFPLRFLTVHGRIARQMYEGKVDQPAMLAVREMSKVPVVFNGDIAMNEANIKEEVMIGRSFIRALGEREDIQELLLRYIEASQNELCGDRPVLGRMKELIAYWKDTPRWHRRWNVVKMCRTVDELRSVL